MSTTALLILALAGLLAGWIVLTILGNERQQQVQQAEYSLRAAQAAAAHAAAVAEAAKKSQPQTAPHALPAPARAK